MVDDDDNGRTMDHGHPISTPCEPNGSGELITKTEWCKIFSSPEPKAHKVSL